MNGPAIELDIRTLRDQFPALDQQVRGRPLAYLDNAATTQKPWAVLRAMQMYYQHDNANVHRAVHQLSHRATRAFDDARATVAEYIHAAHPEEVIFTKGCTEAINLVAASWGRANLQPGDQILVSTMEHHANIVPWQVAAGQAGAHVRPIPITDAGEIDMDAYRQLLSERVKMVAIGHVSNALGTIHPVAEIIRLAHEFDAKVLVDGAQALLHLPVDVQALDADFYAMSAHKMLGPMGTGGLYGKKALLEAMPPYQTGGDMIRKVTFESGTTFAGLPNKFEPGTPNVPGVVGWAAAIKWIQEAGLDALMRRETEIAIYAQEKLSEIEGLTLFGDVPEKVGIFSFVMEGAHPHDIATILDQVGVAVRPGHHCCQPLMQRFGLPATTRASLAFYNTHEDIDQLIEGLRRVQEIFA